MIMWEIYTIQIIAKLVKQDKLAELELVKTVLAFLSRDVNLVIIAQMAQNIKDNSHAQEELILNQVSLLLIHNA